MNTNRRARVFASMAGLSASVLIAAASPVWAGPHEMGSPHGGGDAMQDTMGKVNLNTASVEELARIPEIGLERARAIVDFRDSNGPLYWDEQLLRVKGIGRAELDSFRDKVTVW